MPSLGADMEAGTLVEWLKRPGDQVVRGDVIAVVETQKGAIEVEIFDPGVVDRLLIAPGATVPVGTLLALIREPGEAAERPKREGGVPIPAERPAPPTLPVPPEAPVAGRAPQRAAGVPDRRVRASPAARRLAAQRGVDLRALTGSGPGGAVVSTDLDRHPDARLSGGGQPRPDTVEMRHAIAAAMGHSKREIPHYYLSTTIDLSASLSWLQSVNATRPITNRLLAAALLLKAVAAVLRRFPDFNGHHVDGAFRPSERIHLGTAIALRGGGLVAPALQDADSLVLDELMRRLRDLVGRARSGRLRSSELADPTITVTSLGERGVEGILPIIYPPQVAIIGFGGILDRPWVAEGRVAVRSTVVASLAADHRVSDGHRGSLFLAAIADALQRPEAL